MSGFCCGDSVERAPNQLFFEVRCTFGGLMRLMLFKVRDDERQCPIRFSKERETLAADGRAFLRSGTESPGAMDSSVPAHASRNRFHPAADRALAISAQ